ncbi:MAG: sugar phosphate nucleotidyltransferase [Candidatus Omnitrophica bacterium]|nr:sugar phosphate nucleotidyltransferase [Candidatus Omnitrophota bacterium]
MKAIILAGGKGTRLAPFTATIPKPLFPVGQKTILEIIIRQLREARVREIKLAVGYLAELIEAYFGNGKRFEVSVSYGRETKPLGTAGPISFMRGEKKDFLVMNGDILADMDFTDLFEFHKSSGHIATICCYSKKTCSSLGIIVPDKEGNVEDYLEKPESSFLVSTGIYCFKPAVIKYLKKGEHIDLPDFIRRLIRSGEKVKVYKMNGTWFDIGIPDDYAKAVEYWQNKDKNGKENGKK